MIRKFMSEDVASVMELWLRSIKEAHYFIDGDYWERLRPKMESEYVTKRDCFVYEKNDRIAAMLSLDEDGSILALFVDSPHRRQGIGKELLEYAKRMVDELSISVYEKNVSAIDFFLKNGFEKKYKQTDSNTNETEIFFQWKK